ncbi:hypothetical protein AAE02nite_47690 [Adhaeribacter aerolatus]|uniref:Uncharacterized protein n=1 Tax=Adhaeribacter aerolatus TaxID=670289 RepID=A0A512B549_9BACT|nr:hypothetical protein [Adhaeribacter aerolatus]GEO07105.1 hypothetical protein AAE02nite_47690 [Adhaeribacter aerolatus]
MHALQISRQLTYISTGLAGLAAAGGLGWPDLYQDKALFKLAWLGNDIVTLAVVVPLLLLTLFFARQGSQRAQLLWMGLLGYMFYNYAFYLFGAAFNAFFLLYVALFSLSGYALILGLSALDVRGLGKQFRPETPRKWLSGYLLFISLPLGIFEITQCLGFVFTGNLPQAPSLIFALDLAIVVPNTALAAILLWKQHPWGYVLGAIMLVKAFTYGLVLTVTTTFIAFSGLSTGWDPLMPFYVFVMVGGLVGSLVLLKNLKPGLSKDLSRTQKQVVMNINTF